MLLQRLASASTRWSTRWVPDSWVIAVILTIVAYFLGLIFTKSSSYQLIQNWGSGFWVLLSFGMQMCLIIMTGYILATTPDIQPTSQRPGRRSEKPTRAASP